MDFIKKEYYKIMCNKLSLSEDDLTNNEKILIEFSYSLFNEKMGDIQILKDENRRISIELSNIKTYIDDVDEERKKYRQ